MVDLTELAKRADDLRHRLTAFIDDLGEYATPHRQLHADLAAIEEHLVALQQGKA
jgi:hypothetical protein